MLCNICILFSFATYLSEHTDMLTLEQAREKYELVVGLEVHAQMLTNSKAYSSDSAEFGSLPNTNISVITLAHPGTLPKFNKKVAEYAIKMGLACHCSITEYNTFDRKNYFYPDLPKGYQITQDKTPICKGGYVEVKTRTGNSTTVKLNRIHMEEDAGKSMHLAQEIETLVDLNRAGVPLIEIVSEPDIRDSEEAYSFLTEIRKLVRYLDICDGNMEEGSLRCDANISVRVRGAKEYGKKVEVKNMNSIRNVQRAIDHEFMRQVEMIENNIDIPSETRNFDATTGLTSSLRSKEALNDYRYFPEPDLQPFIISESYLATIREMMPPLPNDLKNKFITEFGLPEYDAVVLTDTKEVALFFVELCNKTTNYKAASNWVMGAIKSYINELSLPIAQFPLSTTQIAQIIELVEQNKLSFSTASQKLFPEMLKNPTLSALETAQKLDLLQDSTDDSIAILVDAALAKFPDKITEYKNGKTGLLGLFVGEVMKASKGKADPKKINELVLKALA
jgi:aspartyl-tRNA(Asn)/glutamyl-tRNA(Gln) amidotransferase subunit B